MNKRRFLMLTLGTALPVIGGVLVAVLPSPWHAGAVVLGLLVAGPIFASPRIGLYGISAMLIGTWPWNVMRYAGILTVASAFAWLSYHGKRLFPQSRIFLLCVAYFLFVLLSTIAPKTRVAIVSAALAYAGFLSLVWLFVTLVCNRNTLLIIVRLMVVSGVITAIIGVVQWRTHFVWIASTTAYYLTADKANYGRTAFDLQQWQGQFRVDSITGTPDFMALYMQSLLPFVMVLLPYERTRLRRFIILGVIALLGIAHLLSFTRGAMLTTAVVLLLTGWCLDKRSLFLIGPTLAIFAIIALVSWAPMRNRVMTILQIQREEAVDQESTAWWRLRALPVGFAMFLRDPILGVGVAQQRWNWPESAFGDILPEREWAEPIPIHNSYLQAGIETGIGGLLTLSAILGVTLWESWRTHAVFRSMGDHEMGNTCLAIYLSMVGVVLAMMFYPMIDTFRYLWLLVGLTASAVKIAADAQRGTSFTVPARVGQNPV